MNIFVGNLAKDVSEQDLEKLFSQFGHVKSTKVIRDLFSGSSKGFGFVDMLSEVEARQAGWRQGGLAFDAAHLPPSRRMARVIERLQARRSHLSSAAARSRGRWRRPGSTSIR